MTEYYFVISSLKNLGEEIYLKSNRLKDDMLPIKPLYQADYVFSLKDGHPVFVKNRNGSVNTFTNEELVIIRLTAKEYTGLEVNPW